jgi:2-oxoisovalerate dehydrogenase E2 component (dihydrolipoyl transacylase)
MTQYVFKMPDLGEGTVSAEVLKWYVGPGDSVEEDQVIAEVMTEKAAIEVPSPVTGRVVRVHGQPGDMVAVGGELIVFETGAVDATASASTPDSASVAESEAPTQPATAVQADGPARAAVEPAERPAGAAGAGSTAARPSGVSTAAKADAPAPKAGRIMASPATRRRAKEAGLDLGAVPGSGPGGRITRADFETALRDGPGTIARGPQAPVPGPGAARTGTTEIRVIGLRRVIAQRMTEAKRNIPHFAYVEEVDVTELESLRVHLNERRRPGQPSLTFLPLIGLALARVLEEFPQCNALYDAERSVIVRHAAVHLGIATQTPDGLKVPVVRNAESHGIWSLATAIRDAAERARTNKSPREELAGSTITITSLGKLGGIVSTPVINAPEVAIVGVNKAVDRPMVVGGAIAVRKMMNLSSSFDHRFVDGYDAAAMIQALKERLEHPATIFMTA